MAEEHYHVKQGWEPRQDNPYMVGETEYHQLLIDESGLDRRFQLRFIEYRRRIAELEQQNRALNAEVKTWREHRRIQAAADQLVKHLSLSL